jgi:hypothetical protein
MIRTIYWGTITTLAHAGTWVFVFAAIWTLYDWGQIASTVKLSVCIAAVGLLTQLISARRVKQ